MADIRINALATTAASTASDDFIAVDGSANGTRKLNAYSPTFGGNLTVSGYADLGSGGIGTPAAGHIQVGGSGSYGAAIIGRGSAYDFGLFNKNGDDVIHVATGTTNVAISGNLTVSGTGTSSVAGTWLIATTTDSGNGKLQLADHTTSAGGIGFGTDTSLYRYGAGRLGISHIGGTTPILYLLEGTTETARLWTANGPCYLDTLTAQPIYFRPNGTTALTLDASQNATFAGAVTVSGADKVLTVTSSASTPGFTMRQTGGIAANRNWGIVINNSANGDFILRRSTTTSGDPTTAVLTFDSTGNATFAGSIAIGNTVQTAASVASTHKVTISIGGSTYYLLATNV